MEIFFIWCSFAGSWLLVAGSIYQAALELKDEDIAHDRLRATAEKVGPRPKVSAWWWFLPPVKLILERKSDRVYRKTYFNAMAREDAEAFVSFLNKATAWIFVAGGGFLIALQETSTVIHPKTVLSIIGYVVTVVVLLFLAIINTVLRIQRSNDMIDTKKQA